MKIKRMFYIILGCISMGLGTVGAFLPLIPTVPLFLLAAFCFARSSQKLHNWFIHTRLYRDNLANYVENKGMTKTVKRRVMITITISIGISLLLTTGICIAQIVLAVVWITLMLYFRFKVKTIP